MPSLTMSVGISTFRLFWVSLTSVNSAFMDAIHRAYRRLVLAHRSSRGCTSEGVRKGGVEPPKPFGYRILSPARLPVPPLSRGRGASGRMLADIRDQVLRDGTAAAGVAVDRPTGHRAMRMQSRGARFRVRVVQALDLFRRRIAHDDMAAAAHKIDDELLEPLLIGRPERAARVRREPRRRAHRR